MFGSYLPEGQTLFGVDVLGVCENEMKKITVGVFEDNNSERWSGMTNLRCQNQEKPWSLIRFKT